MTDTPLEENWVVVRREAINVTRRYTSKKSAEENARFLSQLNNASYAILHHVATINLGDK